MQIKNDKNDLFNINGHITQHLLCYRCEQEFSIKGENGLGQEMRLESGEIPPILKKIKGYPEVFSPARVKDIKSFDLYYFALSMLWRGCQEGWPGYKTLSVSESLLSSIHDYLNPKVSSVGYPKNVLVEIHFQNPGDVWAISLPALTQKGHVVFVYCFLQFLIIQDPVRFSICSESSWGGVPLIYRVGTKSSELISQGLRRAYDEAVPRGKLTRLGQGAEEE